MPSIGRFLFGNWLKTHSVGKVTEFGNRVEASASYRDEFGVTHSRKVVLMHCTLKLKIRSTVSKIQQFWSDYSRKVFNI